MEITLMKIKWIWMHGGLCFSLVVYRLPSCTKTQLVEQTLHIHKLQYSEFNQLFRCCLVVCRLIFIMQAHRMVYILMYFVFFKMLKSMHNRWLHNLNILLYNTTKGIHQMEHLMKDPKIIIHIFI